MSNVSPSRLVNGENRLGIGAPGVGGALDSYHELAISEVIEARSRSFGEPPSSSSDEASIGAPATSIGAAVGAAGAHPANAAAAHAAYNMVAAMNEHLTSSSVTNSVHVTTSGNDVAGPEDAGKATGALGFPCDFDHMYASMTEGGTPATAASALGVSPLRGTEARQNDFTEVKHLKELLLLHLDLIQQQSEQIVTKDKLLAALRQENETVFIVG